MIPKPFQSLAIACQFLGLAGIANSVFAATQEEPTEVVIDDASLSDPIADLLSLIHI